VGGGEVTGRSRVFGGWTVLMAQGKDLRFGACVHMDDSE